MVRKAVVTVKDCYFFFQAEDGIRDWSVTGVQTCALPILKKITKSGDFCGSPKWMGDSSHVIAYCMTAEQTLAIRRPSPDPGNDTRLVSIDTGAAASTELNAGPGVKINPSWLPGNEIGYIRKDTADPGNYYS